VGIYVSVGGGVSVSVNLRDLAAASVSAPYSLGENMLPGPFEHDYTQAIADFGTPITFSPEGQGPLALGVYWPEGSSDANILAVLYGSIDGVNFDDGDALANIGGNAGAGPWFNCLPNPCVLFPYIKVIFSNDGDSSPTEAALKVWQPF
jgi:hypothetical protein